MERKAVVGVFQTAEALLGATREARKRGLRVQDVFTPYPVHGMDEALGLGRSRLSAVCLALGLTGGLFAFLFQEWVYNVSWPINIGGKPDNAWPAFIPVTFELTVLFAGVGSILVFLFWRGLGPLKTAPAARLGSTNDKFLLVLEGESAQEPKAFLKAQRALEIEELA